MRRSLVVLAVGWWFVSGLVAAEILPLADHSDDAAQVVPALMALSHGDALPLCALPAHLYRAEVGIADPHTPDLVWRWTELLPRALARLDRARQAEVLHALDQRFAVVVAAVTDVDAAAALAMAFRPAPSARSTLVAAADRAFDYGQLRDYLAWQTLSELPDLERAAVAEALTGDAATVAPGLELTAPGPLDTGAPPADPPSDGLSVRWAVAPGWLLACDPAGQVRWQLRTARRAVIVTGPGGAVIHDDAGLRLISESGHLRQLSPLPSGGQILVVAGGAAWFTVGATLHRLDLGAGGVTTLVCPQVTPPIGAPLVRGRTSVWLTSDELLLISDGALSARFRHALPVGPGWRLGWARGEPVLLAPDAPPRRITSLATALAAASTTERLDLLMQAQRYHEVIALHATLARADVHANHLALCARLAVGHAVTDLAGLLALAATTDDQALVLVHARSEAALEALCQREPSVRFSPEPRDPSESPTESSWLVTGAAWHRRLHTGQAAAVASAPGQPVDHLAAPSAIRQHDGSLRIAEDHLRLVQDPRHTVLRCTTAAGELRWQRRWPTLPTLLAPGCQVWAADGAVVVIEGAARLRAFTLTAGVRLSELALDGHETLAESVCLAGDGSAWWLAPSGVNDRLVHLALSGRTVRPLPSRGRWLVPATGGVVVALVDDQARRYPDDLAVEWPTVLIHGARPQATSAGLERDTTRWPWLRISGEGDPAHQ